MKQIKYSVSSDGKIKCMSCDNVYAGENSVTQIFAEFPVEYVGYGKNICIRTKKFFKLDNGNSAKTVKLPFFSPFTLYNNLISAQIQEISFSLDNTQNGNVFTTEAVKFPDTVENVEPAYGTPIAVPVGGKLSAGENIKITESADNELMTYTISLKSPLEKKLLISDINNLSSTLDTKVDKVTGKTLTDNNFSSSYKVFIDNLMASPTVDTFVEKSYDELKALKLANQLTAGVRYLIKDYVTKYVQPHSGVLMISPAERIIITATGSNSFSPLVVSQNYVNDIIFYDFDDSNTGLMDVQRKGFIKRRIDTVNRIDMPYDWRTMLWARYKADAPVWVSGSVALNGHYKSGNDIYLVRKAGVPSSGTDSVYFMKICTVNDYIWTKDKAYTGLTLNLADYALRYTFNQDTSLTKKAATAAVIMPYDIAIDGADSLPDNVFCYSTTDNRPHMIRAGGGFTGNTFMSSCYKSSFGNNYSCNLSAGQPTNSFSKNSFGNDCTFNQFFVSAIGNSVGNGCTSNTFANTQNNVIGNNCTKNIMSGNMGNNVFGSNCNSNNMNNFSYCSFSSGFSNNTLNSANYSYFNINVSADVVYQDISSISWVGNKAGYNISVFKSNNRVYATYVDGTPPAVVYLQIS